MNNTRKIIVNYDEASGDMFDANNVFFTAAPTNAYQFDYYKEADAKSGNSELLNSLKELKAAGFTVEDIMQFKREGVI